jgi:hypothetical protein
LIQVMRVLVTPYFQVMWVLATPYFQVMRVLPLDLPLCW